jgi:DNA polymerase I-like protein with 3'-5' exonuclease and polymerase domains
LLHVHDEIILEVPDSKRVVATAQRLLKKCMEQAVELKVPLVVKMQIGDSWGNLENIEH